MKKIWAPWRSNFIYNRKRKGCIFCVSKDRKSEKESYIIKKTQYSFSMLNIYPYNNGHIMVSPKRHTGKLSELSRAELIDLMLLLNETTSLIDNALKPDGYNIGINVGDAAGAGYPGHIHIHIVPRWKGDTNFMPVLAEVKIISESLDSLYKRLKKACR
jgi:ATP adenylyltransferase